ncbi:hypothetical protein [Inquilinus sp. OTU3971]|uniref:hypothetical protein n=1 Tax=Inquilinus sp. OTU3971 TaxID=3043855 RepID=UPI00313C95D2
MASSYAGSGIRKPWIVIPALLLIDAFGLLNTSWFTSDLREISAQLAMRADVVKIMVPSSFIMLFGAIFPVLHILGWLAVRARRLRKPVLGLREERWWLITGVLLFGMIPLTWVADRMIGDPLREQAAVAGYIECDGIFDRLRPYQANTTYALSADLCRQAGFKRSRIEPDFDTPRPPG